MCTLIYRDPFARFDFVRVVVPPVAGQRSPDCLWCGAPAARFQYGYSMDAGGKPQMLRGNFCRVGCCREYHGIDLSLERGR